MFSSSFFFPPFSFLVRFGLFLLLSLCGHREREREGKARPSTYAHTPCFGKQTNGRPERLLIHVPVLLYDSMTTLQRRLRSLDAVSTGLASFQSHTPLERDGSAKAKRNESKKAR